MQRFFKEIVILLLQLIMFYLLPFFSGPTDAMGMILIMIIFTFILSILISVISNEKIKYLYPIIVAIIFIPSVFIYYNISALIHSVWYFVISYIGIFIGMFIRKIIFLIKEL